MKDENIEKPDVYLGAYLSTMDIKQGDKCWAMSSDQYCASMVLQGAVRYAFCISHPSIDKPLSAAIFRAILTLSLETTDEYVMDEGDAVM